MKLTVNPQTVSRQLVNFVEEKGALKEQTEPEDKPMIIFVDDVHLSSEQMNELLRYTVEYRKMFSLKNKTTYSLPRHFVVAEANDEPQRPFRTRLSRHFAHISLPLLEETSIRKIFTSLIKNVVNRTNTSAEFKASYDLELDKVVHFLSSYLRISNNAFLETVTEGTTRQQKMRQLSFCDLLPIIRSMWVLDE